MTQQIQLVETIAHDFVDADAPPWRLYARLGFAAVATTRIWTRRAASRT